MAVSAPPNWIDTGQPSMLIDACHDAGYAFDFAARAMKETMLRAEFVQYSLQRREFIVELQDAMRSMGDDAGEDGAADDDERWAALQDAANRGDVAAMIDECGRFDLHAMNAYRRAMHVGLPYVLAGVIRSHYFALGRVQSRLQVLADVARGIPPIDSGDV